MHQSRVRPALYVEAHYRLGVGHAQVEAPVRELHAEAIGVIHGQGITAIARLGGRQ